MESAQDTWIILDLSWLVIVILGSILGNVMVMYVVLFHLHLRTVTNHFIVALSASDLLCAVLAMPLVLATVATGDWVGGEGLCVAHGVVTSTLGTLSTLVLVFITLERYWSVVRLPKSAPEVWVAWVLVGLALVASLLLSIPWHFLLSSDPADYYKGGYRHCMYLLHGKESPGGGLGYSVTYMLLSGFLPFTLMSTGAGFMYQMIRRSHRRTQPASAQPKELRFSSEVRTAGTVIVMVLLATLTKGPYFLFGLSYAIAGTPLPSNVDTLCMWLYWTSCTVNPIVYAIRNPNVGVILNIRRGSEHSASRHRHRHRHRQPSVASVPEQGHVYVIPAISPSQLSTHSSSSKESVGLDNVDLRGMDVRSDSLPSVLFYVDRYRPSPRKGSDFSAVTSSTVTTTV